MKNCRDYADQISGFLDGELSGPERRELMEHMAACRNCRQYFDDLAAIREAAAAIGEVPVPEGFARQVMDRVRTTEQDRAGTPKAVRIPWRRWAALAACCALALLGAWGVRNMRETHLAIDQEMDAADDMARTAGAAGLPEAMDGGEGGASDEEQPVGEVLSRMADSGSETAEAEEDAVEVNADLPEYLRQTAAEDASAAEAAKDAPAPSPTAPGGDAAGGTLIAGGELVRQWVEDELGLDWESGRTYELTEEQYAGLVDFLTEAGVEFRMEAGDACRLMAE